MTMTSRETYYVHGRKAYLVNTLTHPDFPGWTAEIQWADTGLRTFCLPEDLHETLIDSLTL